MIMKMQFSGSEAVEIPDPTSDPEAQERTARLRDAVRLAGGNAVVAKASGVPLSTLSAYMDGRDMKVSRAAAIARACGVSLDWLATGRMADQAGQPPAALASTVNFQKLGAAIELSVASYSEEGPIKSWGSVAISTAMFYDNLTAPGADAEALIAKVRKSLPGG